MIDYFKSFRTSLCYGINVLYYDKDAVEQLPRIFRINLINSISGFKPANLIATKSKKQQTNVAIISSVVHMGSSPALFGYFLRPTTVPRHTYENIIETGKYTINHVNQDIIKQAHYTSADFAREQSEFEACRLTEEYLEDFEAPYVKESKVKIGLTLREEIPIKANGTILIVGEVQHLYLPNNFVDEEGRALLSRETSVVVSGLDTYHRTEFLATYPYARVADCKFE